MSLITTHSSQNRFWRTRALIDLQSLHHNIAVVRKIAARSRIMAVIKADAYGHGLETVTAAIHQQVDAFAVATLSEGIACRKIQNHKPVVVLSEFWQPSQLEDFEKYNMQPVIHSQQQVRWLQAYSGKPLTVWIEFETGMHRLGIPGRQLSRACDSLKALQSIRNVRIMSHLASADIPGDEYTDRQLENFESASSLMQCEKSLANSAGIMRSMETHKDWVRPGLMLYGISPFIGSFEGSGQQNINLKPVMQLKARLVAIKSVDRDQPVGYGGTYRTKRQSRIAVVGLGYGDGYPRNVNTEARVLIRGKRLPIIGRISMDMITVDATDHASVEVGDEVTLWGHDLPAEEVARWAEMIPYELICKVTARVPRIVSSVKRV